jgi:hypothetical protein
MLECDGHNVRDGGGETQCFTFLFQICGTCSVGILKRVTVMMLENNGHGVRK